MSKHHRRIACHSSGLATGLIVENARGPCRCWLASSQNLQRRELGFLTLPLCSLCRSPAINIMLGRILGELICVLLFASALARAQSAPADLPVQSARATQSQSSYRPITERLRFQWFVNSTLGPESLGAGLFTAGLGTARDAPREYGPHWGGFGKRYGMRLSGIATSNAIEAGLGALWGEDPRYLRASGQPFKSRLENALISTVATQDRAGDRMPAYARYMAIPGNNFLANTWRADSEANNRDAALRTLWGFLGEMGKNMFLEFWPDAEQQIFHHKRQPDGAGSFR
jgi:hypothetical protein